MGTKVTYKSCNHNDNLLFVVSLPLASRQLQALLLVTCGCAIVARSMPLLEDGAANK